MSPNNKSKSNYGDYRKAIQIAVKIGRNELLSNNAPQKNNLCIQLIKVQVTNGQMGDGGPKDRQPSLLLIQLLIYQL